MRHLLLILLTLAITPIAFAEDGAASSADVAATETQDIKKVVPYAISLLEKKDYSTFLKTFVPPEQMAKATKSQTFEQFAQGFGERKADTMLAVLKAIKGLDPKMEKDDTVALFTVPEEAAKTAKISRREIAFVKVEKRWYIGN